MASFLYRIDGVLPASESHWSCHAADELWLIILAFLRRGSLIVKGPFGCILGQRREFRRFLFGTYHRRDQLASLLTENFAKPPQVLDVISCHVQPLAAEPSIRALQDLSKKSGRGLRCGGWTIKRRTKDFRLYGTVTEKEAAGRAVVGNAGRSRCLQPPVGPRRC